ncbi:hypothetical protein C7964_1165 [Loktanella sp. PT4BL]|jgi:hypothetical protein|nr:hypothetical protein C7964_1165 [Loktanella sp. PT4BL]
MNSVDARTGPREGEDNIPATPEDPISSSGGLLILGNHRLQWGDITVATNIVRPLGTVKLC